MLNNIYKLDLNSNEAYIWFVLLEEKTKARLCKDKVIYEAHIRGRDTFN